MQVCITQGQTLDVCKTKTSLTNLLVFIYSFTVASVLYISSSVCSFHVKTDMFLHNL